MCIFHDCALGSECCLNMGDLSRCQTLIISSVLVIFIKTWWDESSEPMETDTQSSSAVLIQFGNAIVKLGNCQAHSLSATMPHSSHSSLICPDYSVSYEAEWCDLGHKNKSTRTEVLMITAPKTRWKRQHPIHLDITVTESQTLLNCIHNISALMCLTACFSLGVCCMCAWGFDAC